MQVAIQARCWDGVRTKMIIEDVLAPAAELVPVAERPQIKSRLMAAARRMRDPKMLAILGYAIPMMLISHSPLPLMPVVAHAAAAAVPSGAVPAGGSVTAMAATTDFQDKIIHAFDPLITLIKSLSYPIAGVMIAGGCLFIMVGNREKGMQMLQNAAIGYFLVQLSPLLLKLLVSLGSGL